MSYSATLTPTAGRPDARYDTVAQSLHWLIVGLVIIQFTTELILPRFLDKASMKPVYAWHAGSGTTILLIMAVRLVWRLTHTPPAAPDDLSPGLRLLSRTTHWAMYILLLGLPFGGWAALNAFGGTAKLFGLIPLPALVGPDKALGQQIGAVHGNLALLLLAIIALHLAGSVYHAAVKRDRVVARMVPGA